MHDGYKHSPTAYIIVFERSKQVMKNMGDSIDETPNKEHRLYLQENKPNNFNITLNGKR